MNPVALVAEGGGMRGIFTAGVLDAFYSKGFNPFTLFIGVSAGACNLSSHIAGQYQRNSRIFTRLMTRPGFISKRKFLSGGHLMDLDWLWDTIDREDPLDVPAIIGNLNRLKKELVIVMTSAETGMPLYVTPTLETLNDELKASSAVPLFYRDFITINGVPVVDGGVADPIPVEEAYRRGAKTIFVIRTRPAEYVKKQGIESAAVAFALRRFPPLHRALLRQAAVYRRAVEFMKNPPNDAKIIQIAPDCALKSKRTSKDRGSLDADYEQGVRVGSRIERLGTD